jgi:hypothetical protein
MKRSQAVTIIRDRLYYRINGCTICPEWLASAILEDLEDAGIYPPDTVQEGHDVTMWDKETNE